jgi:histidinol-phosphate aminotransferase
VQSTTETKSRVEGRLELEMICPYEPGKPIEEVRRELGLERITKLASNENPLGPSPRVIETLNRSNLQLHMYPDYEGWYLRQALASRLAVAPEQVILGAGSAELMRLIADAYLDRGDEAVMADLCFAVYQNVTVIARARPVIVPVDSKLDHDLERMLEVVTPRTKVVFLASPNNPTGRLIPAADLKGFLERLPPTVLCVLDLAYLEYVSAPGYENLMDLVRQHPNLVLLRTFSKVYGLAGLRIGYAVAASDVTGWLARMRIPFNTSTAAQVAALAALADEEHVKRAVALNQASRTQLADGAERIGFRATPSHANFVLLEGRLDSEMVFQSLLVRGIVIRPMRHPRLSRCIRVSTGTAEQMEELLERLQELHASSPAR